MLSVTEKRQHEKARETIKNFDAGRGRGGGGGGGGGGVKMEVSWQEIRQLQYWHGEQAEADIKADRLDKAFAHMDRIKELQIFRSQISTGLKE